MPRLQTLHGDSRNDTWRCIENDRSLQAPIECNIHVFTSRRERATFCTRYADMLLEEEGATADNQAFSRPEHANDTETGKNFAASEGMIGE